MNDLNKALETLKKCERGEDEKELEGLREMIVSKINEEEYNQKSK